MISETKTDDYDIAVAGGGLSGVAAAIAAAREGARVLLIERYGFLGGMATAGLVTQFMPYAIWNGNWNIDWSKRVNRGIFEEMLTGLQDMSELADNQILFNEEALKLILDRMTKKYQVAVLLHTCLTGVEKNGNAIQSLLISSKSGKSSIQARYFVDATGDADLSAMAGVESKIGRDEDGLCQPMTLIFRIGDVNTDLFDPVKMRDAVNEKFKEWKAKGLINSPNDKILAFHHQIKGIIHLNATRISGRSALDAEDLTAAEMEAREQAWAIFAFLKNNFTGFEKSRIMMSAPQIGIRESRRISGEYLLTAEDLISVKKFTDSIARGTYPMDIHDPAGSGITTKEIPYGDYYTIPYRSLVPKGIRNLLVAGRPISSTHEAHSAYRVMPICTCIGEGAGVASFLALQQGIPCKDVSAIDIHKILDRHQALY